MGADPGMAGEEMTPQQFHSDKRLPDETPEQYRARRDASKRRSRMGRVLRPFDRLHSSPYVKKYDGALETE